MKYNFRYDLWLNTGDVTEALGLRYWPEIPWKLSEANKRGLPVSGRLYGNVPYTPQDASVFETGADFLQEGWYGGGLEYRAEPHQSWYSPEAANYMARQTQGQMLPLTKNSMFMSWMEPLGETSPGPWLDENRDTSPNAVRSWQSELRDTQRFTLAQVSRMYRLQDHPFTRWEEVPLPTYDFFAGWPERVVDLTGIWSCRPETKQGEGAAGAWWNSDPTTADWVSLRMPGSDLWYQLESNGRGAYKWCTRNFTLAANDLSSHKPIYLYEFLRPANFGRPVIAPIYINGRKVGDVGPWAALDVTSYLRAGTNRIDLETTGWDGRVYLSREAPATYPNFSEDRNRLFTTWIDWILGAKRNFIATNLSAMRRVDPNRPIKMMAPGEGTDNWLSLASHYGAYAHFTGEGMWFYPWNKRYGYLYGVPGSSEGAGPANSTLDEYRTFDRVFLEGLNTHEDVFDVQMYTRVPELRAWYENHAAMLKQLGRYDIAGPQILLYRSDKSSVYRPPNIPIPNFTAGHRELQDPYNWDIGRGALQTLGQSYLYISDNGIHDHKLDGYNVLVDCGNPYLGQASSDGIKSWVASGGTYITWPFTGQNSYVKPNVWPVNALTGCRVKALRTPGHGTVTFVPGEQLLPGWGGHSFADAGHCIDSSGREDNEMSTELIPGGDCTVVARFEDGAPAIVVHRIGKGRVVALGSAFFRQVADRMGIWWSQPIETDFWKALLDHLGSPSVNTTDNRLIWPQRYRMNNGMDDVVIVNNFAEADKNFTLTTTLAKNPSRVYRVSKNTVEPVPFSLANGKVVIHSAIGNNEVQAYIFRTHDARDAAQHWWNYQQRMWKPTIQTGGYVLPQGKQPWTDPTLDLTDGWKWTQQPVGANSVVQDAGWKSYPLDILTFAGADSSKPIYLRRHFSVPPSWLARGATRFEQGPSEGSFYRPGEDGQVFLNGTLLHDWAHPDYFTQEMQGLLRPGDNVLAFNLRPGSEKYLGVIGTTFLVHQDPPLTRIDLAGRYQAKRDGQPVVVTFPGVVNCSFPTKSVFIPAAWKDKYEVAVYLRCTKTRPDGVWVNDRCYHRASARTNDLEMDVT
ncbi:MAG: hypothetical protein M3Y56_09230, partial [Armatimonadota bacterium]|nr:hypothetical protein [Armatimonadota bacterium]